MVEMNVLSLLFCGRAGDEEEREDLQGRLLKLYALVQSTLMPLASSLSLISRVMRCGTTWKEDCEAMLSLYKSPPHVFLGVASLKMKPTGEFTMDNERNLACSCSIAEVANYIIARLVALRPTSTGQSSLDQPSITLVIDNTRDGGSDWTATEAKQLVDKLQRNVSYIIPYQNVKPSCKICFIDELIKRLNAVDEVDARRTSIADINLSTQVGVFHVFGDVNRFLYPLDRTHTRFPFLRVADEEEFRVNTLRDPVWGQQEQPQQQRNITQLPSPPTQMQRPEPPENPFGFREDVSQQPLQPSDVDKTTGRNIWSDVEALVEDKNEVLAHGIMPLPAPVPTGSRTVPLTFCPLCERHYACSKEQHLVGHKPATVPSSSSVSPPQVIESCEATHSETLRLLRCGILLVVPLDSQAEHDSCPRQMLPTERWCSLCKMVINGDKNWIQHVAGDKHKKNVRTAGSLSVSFYCTTCESDIFGDQNIVQHIRGSRHAKRAIQRTHDCARCKGSFPSDDAFALHTCVR